MKKLLVYATKGGDTKVVSEYIASKLGFEIKEAKELNEEDLAGASAFIFAASTHGDGQIQAKFDDKYRAPRQRFLQRHECVFAGA